MSEPKSLEEKIEREKMVGAFFDQEFKSAAGRIYSKLIELHLNELEARQWFYAPNTYLNNKSPHHYCINGGKSEVLKVAQDEIARTEWIVNS